ncbi:MAG: T9SS type A sorting domain-containing protein, partial [Bacteroidota bacterium]
FVQPAVPWPIDSVWPGDANADFLVNNVDVLALGLGFGQNGPSRPMASLLWTPQAAPNWVNTLSNTVNYKHIDTDGDGIIQSDDTLAIHLNYGLSHNKTGEGNCLTGIPLWIDILQDSLKTGDTLRAEIGLGTDSLPSPAVYGLVFSLSLDTSLVKTASMEVDFPNSWLGTANSDLLGFWHLVPEFSRLDFALTRLDQVNRAGYGRIASIDIIIVDDISGKKDLMETLKMGLSLPYMINNREEFIPVCMSGDTALIIDETATNLEDELAASLHVFPNPATTFLSVKSDQYPLEKLVAWDAQGRQMTQELLSGREARISLQDWPSGLYLFQITTSQGSLSRTIFVNP